MNKNPERPENIDEILTSLFNKNKKKKLQPHQDAAKEISKMLKEKGL